MESMDFHTALGFNEMFADQRDVVQNLPAFSLFGYDSIDLGVGFDDYSHCGNDGSDSQSESSVVDDNDIIDIETVDDIDQLLHNMSEAKKKENVDSQTAIRTLPFCDKGKRLHTSEKEMKPCEVRPAADGDLQTNYVCPSSFFHDDSFSLLGLDGIAAEDLESLFEKFEEVADHSENLQKFGSTPMEFSIQQNVDSARSDVAPLDTQSAPCSQIVSMEDHNYCTADAVDVLKSSDVRPKPTKIVHSLQSYKIRRMTMAAQEIQSNSVMTAGSLDTNIQSERLELSHSQVQLKSSSDQSLVVLAQPQPLPLATSCNVVTHVLQKTVECKSPVCSTVSSPLNPHDAQAVQHIVSSKGKSLKTEDESVSQPPSVSSNCSNGCCCHHRREKRSRPQKSHRKKRTHTRRRSSSCSSYASDSSSSSSSESNTSSCSSSDSSRSRSRSHRSSRHKRSLKAHRHRSRSNSSNRSTHSHAHGRNRSSHRGRSSNRSSHSRTRRANHYSRNAYKTKRSKRTRRARSSSIDRSSSSGDEEKQQRYQDEHNKAMSERRVVYAGGIPPSYTRADLRKRFGGFGEIERVSIHIRRDNGDSYGFVTFFSKNDAYAAIEKGNDVHGPKFTLCFGGRRMFCKTEYADLDGCTAVKEEWAPVIRSKAAPSDDFDALLQQSVKNIKKS